MLHCAGLTVILQPACSVPGSQAVHQANPSRTSLVVSRRLDRHSPAYVGYPVAPGSLSSRSPMEFLCCIATPAPYSSSLLRVFRYRQPILITPHLAARLCPSTLGPLSSSPTKSVPLPLQAQHPATSPTKTQPSFSKDPNTTTPAPKPEQKRKERASSLTKDNPPNNPGYPPPKSKRRPQEGWLLCL